MNSKGVIKDIKSKNSYIVIINNIEKNISGDHMSLISNDSNNENVNIIPDETLNDIDDIYSDTDSITEYDSDDEIYSNLPNSTHINNDNIPRRKSRTEVQKLQNIPLNNRLRPRN